MSRALLQQALDALQESLSKLSPFAYENELRTGEYGIIRAIEALKEELAKPENNQEPVAIIGSIDMINLTAKVNFIPAVNGLKPDNFDIGFPLFDHQPQPKLTPSDFWNAAPWQPMETAPLNKSILVKFERYVGQATKYDTGNIFLAGIQMPSQLKAIAWLPLPAPEQK